MLYALAQLHPSFSYSIVKHLHQGFSAADAYHYQRAIMSAVSIVDSRRVPISRLFIIERRAELLD